MSPALKFPCWAARKRKHIDGLEGAKPTTVDLPTLNQTFKTLAKFKVFD